MPPTSLTEGIVTTPRHTSFYLAAGPERGPAVIFIHGWPELSLSWRHQLPGLAGLGFRAIAPDMRGYGRSSVYRNHADYGLQHAVADMLELADKLGIEKAVWVGHDWGSPVAWSIVSHHPERCHAVASLCVPYWTIEHGLDSIIPLVDRRVYPEDQFPAGQWEYMRFYEENFDKARRVNLLNWDGKGRPEGLFPPRREEGDPQPCSPPTAGPGSPSHCCSDTPTRTCTTASAC